MGLVAEFVAASPKLFLTPTLEALEGVEVLIERQYAIDPARPVAFCWIAVDDGGRVERALANDETVDSFDRVEETSRRDLYRIRRSGSAVVDAYGEWVPLGAEYLRGRGANGRWDVRMRFPSRRAFTEYHTFLEDAGVTFDLVRLATGDTGVGSGGRLTSPQREAIRLAYEEGFFDVPRGVTLGDLAATLGISDQAVSERIRRGQARLAAEHVG